MELGFQGGRAFATWGARGLGRAIALELAAEGTDVAVCSRSADETQRVVQETDASEAKE